MNIHDYRKEIETLRKAAFDINDIAVKIQDSQGGMDDHGDLIASEADVQSLFLATRLILEVLPTDPSLIQAPKLLKQRDELRKAVDVCLEALLDGRYKPRFDAVEQARAALLRCDRF